MNAGSRFPTWLVDDMSKAVKRGQRDVVENLLDQYPELVHHRLTVTGSSWAQLAAANGQPQVIEPLVRHGLGSHALDTALYKELRTDEGLEVIRELLRLGANANFALEKDSLLHRAQLTIFTDSHPITALLLENGANPNVFDKDSFTPLHLAVKRGRFESAAILIENGADINARQEDGPTVWDMLNHSGNPEFVAKFKALTDANSARKAFHEVEKVAAGLKPLAWNL